RIVIDRNYPFRSEACRRQCQNSRSRPQIEECPFCFRGAQAASLPVSAASRNLFRESSSASCRRVQAGSLRSPEPSRFLEQAQRHGSRHVLSGPERRAGGNNQSRYLIPILILTPARRNNYQSL